MFKKIILFVSCWIVCLTCVWAAGSNAKLNTVTLRVKNSWLADIKVHEGSVFVNTVIIPQGQLLDLVVLFPFITNLTIKYKSEIDEWFKVPGCPQGNFFSGLTVDVSVNSFNPQIPFCSWNPVA